MPMGTIVTVCMLIGLIAASVPAKHMPLAVRKITGTLVLAAGSWNLFWHALRHLNQFWGIAALVSGMLMIITGAYLWGFRIPAWLLRARPVVLALMLGCAALYAITIYRL